MFLSQRPCSLKSLSSSYRSVPSRSAVHNLNCFEDLILPEQRLRNQDETIGSKTAKQKDGPCRSYLGESCVTDSESPIRRYSSDIMVKHFVKILQNRLI